MADIKWIKIVTDIFDNRKIRQIEKLPDADAILIIWFKLLCLAGDINENGLIIMTKDIPYTDEMLSVEFNKPIAVIRMALEIFQRFEMIEIINNIYCVSNWDKYQNIDGLEKIREQNRKRVAQYRERQKKLVSNQCNVTSNVTVTECNAIDKDIDKEKDIIEQEKKKYADYVSLKDSEYEKLVKRFGERFTKECITVLDNYKGAKKGRTYESDYRAILSWVVKRVEGDGLKPQPTKTEEYLEVDTENLSGEEYTNLIKGAKNVR